MSALFFLAARATHVLVAALWIGSSVFVSAMLMPALDASGPSGGQVMARMDRAGFHTYMAILSGATLLTGIYLFWHFTGGFDPAVSITHAGLAFGCGGLAGIGAGIIGGAVVSRSAKQTVQLAGKAASLPDGPEKVTVTERLSMLRRRMKAGSKAIIVLQTTAVILMAVGHYV